MVSNGSYVGNYCIIKDIASGAFGQVYLAQHAVLTNRTVAIKLLHMIHFSSPQETARFFKEAQILERLKHPHILSIIDIGIHEGFPYLVTEYASNGSLRDYIQRPSPRRLSQEKVLTILSQIGQALQHALQQGIIHRDLKPENILFNAEGKALLADFGLATMLATASVKEASIVGTLAYMAPEQFGNTICKESDQYALGCIAYELFTGRAPFDATNIATLVAQCLQEEPIPPRRYNPQLPINIEAAILKALSKDRAKRHSDIAAFIAALNISASTLSDDARKQWETEVIGIVLMFPGNKEMIIAACERILQLDPSFGGAYYYKGVALYDLERYSEALAALRSQHLLIPIIHQAGSTKEMYSSV
ncbi:MAG TPA: protein kinase [Methylomirabilota bacterium]|nr:protein kinase [Methylomirabilota bacterium]